MAQIYKCDTCGNVCESTGFPASWVVVSIDVGGNVTRSKRLDVCDVCLKLPVSQRSAKGFFQKVKDKWASLNS